MDTNQPILITSESVTEGHPDKMADQISDAILDAIYSEDPQARVACETLLNTGVAVIAGEITTKCYVDIPKIARKVIEDIGYTDSSFGFDAKTCSILTTIDEQSPDIAMGVNEDDGLHKEQGAGDQGMMFGYACKETDELMPLPITLAHKLTRQLASVRKDGTLAYLRPDGKSQVTVQYDHDGKPVRVHTIVVSTQHDEHTSLETIKNDVIEHVVKPVCGHLIDEETIYHINPTGVFIIGGPMGDAGLTGRKIIVDTYGGIGRHGGGAFSGKDPSKVDRSAAYAARYVAKNIVAADLADTCEVQLAYAIGVAQPVSINVNTFGTGKISDRTIETIVRSVFDLSPKGIIDHLQLRRPIYRKTAAYGHFGRSEDLESFTWEKTDKVPAIKECAAGLSTEHAHRGLQEEATQEQTQTSIAQ